MRNNKEQAEVNPEMKKKCCCGPECDCGCNEGKECACCSKQGGCGCNCGCGKKCGGKLLILLLVFLAGMGFNELLHGGFRCMGKCPHAAMAKHAPHPAYTDGAGTVIIINTAEGGAEVQRVVKPHHMHNKQMKAPHINMPHHKNMHNPEKPAAQTPAVPEADKAE